MKSLTFWIFALSGVALGQGTPVLSWKNSETLEGKLVGADETSITWKSVHFAEPIRIAIDHLNALRVPSSSSAPKEEFAVDLVDGGRFFGDLAGLDADSVTLATENSGNVRIRRDAIQEVRRLSGGGLVWSGPYGTAGWKFEKVVPDPVPASRWIEAESGVLRNIVWGDPARLLMDFPEQFELEFRLETLRRPEFSIQLGAEGRLLLLETWDEILVVRRGSQFRRVLDFNEEDRFAQLRLFWDAKNDLGMICSATGEKLAEFSDLGNEKLSPESVTITNKGAGLDLTRLRVREWDGSEPAIRELAAAGKIGVERIDGSWVGEAPDSLDNRKIQAGGEEIALDELQAIRFASPEVAPEADNSEVRLADTTRFYGKISGGDDSRLRFETAFSVEPLEIEFDEIAELKFHGADAAAPEGMKNLDSLVFGGQTIRGRWEPGPGKTIRWQLPGAFEAVPVADTLQKKASVNRAAPNGRWPEAASLFHLTSQEIAEGELVSISEDGDNIEVRSDHFELKKLEPETLSAAVLRPLQIRTRGFSDPGWRVLTENEDLVEIQKTAVGKITIQPGGAIGHPAFLQGNQIEFRLHGVERYSTLKLRLFCGDLEDQGGSTDLVFFYYNDRIYLAQTAQGLRGVINQQQVNITPGSNVPVLIRWDEKMTRATVNGVTLEIPMNERAPRSGRGIIFEPGDMWNNGLRTVALSHLRLKREPGFTWSPPVSAEVKEKVLFVPRFRAERPHRHALFATNGDVLRGTIETATSAQIAFRSGLDTITFDRDRAAAAVWLKPALEDGDGETKPENSNPSSHWIILGSGARYHLEIEDFGPEFLSGKSSVLGACRIPIENVFAVSPVAPDPDPATLAFAGWRLKKAPFPNIPGESEGAPGSMENQDAPEFSLKNLDGEAIELDGGRRKIVVLDFWATWCAPCHRSMPELREAVAEFPKEDVRLIAVNQGEAAPRVKDFLETREWDDLEVALDPNQTVGNQFEVEGLPHVVVIGPDGKIAFVETGYRPGGAEAVGNVIRQLLGEDSQ